jgi:predicted dehydrogenase
LVKLAVSRGVHAICQKPMAPTWGECVELANTADGSRARVMIHENWRWQPWYREAKRLLLAGAIGRPFSYRMHTRKRDGLGPNPFPDQPYFRTMPRLLIYETIVHHLDTARFLFGKVSSIYAQVRRNNPILAGEDQAQLLLTHESELLGMIDGHRLSDTTPVGGPVLGEAWVDGESATLRIDASGDLYVGPELKWRNSVTLGYRGDSVRATQQHFIECLRTGDRFESDARDYLRTVALVEAAYESAHLRCAVCPVVE